MGRTDTHDVFTPARRSSPSSRHGADDAGTDAAGSGAAGAGATRGRRTRSGTPGRPWPGSRRRPGKPGGCALHGTLRRLPRRGFERGPRAQPVRRRLGPRRGRRRDCAEHHARGAEHGDGAVQGPAHRTADLANGGVSQDSWRHPQGEADLRGRPRRAGRQVGAADVQDGGGGARAGDALGSGVPAGRAPADHRAPGTAADGPERSTARGAGLRNPDRMGAAGRGPARRRGSPAHTRARACPTSDLGLCGTGREQTPRRRRRRAAAAAAPAARAGRDGRPRPPVQHVEHRHRPREDQREERVGGSAGHPADEARAVHGRQLAFRSAVHLRSAVAPVLHDRRSRRDEQCAGSRQPARQDPPRQRRRLGSQGQPVREQAGRPAIDLELRPPQSAGARVGSRHGQAVGVRARPARGRRDQHRRAGPELRLGRHHDGCPGGHHQRAHEGMEQPVVYYTPSDCAERHHVLYRRPVSRLEEQPVRERPCRSAAPPPGDLRETR